MIDENDNPRPDLPLPKWEQLDKLCELPLPTLARFIHGCSEDPNERTLATTVLVTSLCQLTGRPMMRPVPSTIVINALDLAPDPVDLLAGLLLPEPSEPVSGFCQHISFFGGTAKDAPWAMAQAIEEKSKLGKVTPLNADTHNAWEDRFFAAQSAGFGSGPGRGYAKAWNDTFGLLTDPSGELILRIDSLEDRRQFCRDVVKGTQRLREPLGYGPELTLIPKHIALSGSLPASDCKAPLATSLVELGLPMLMLPSLTKETPDFVNDAVLQFIASSMPRSISDPVEEPANLIQEPWFGAYGRELRARLRHLPESFEYAMHKLARQLFPACLRIANWCGTFSETSTEEIMAMTKDLCGHALRGTMISVAGLAWHGLGFDSGYSHATVVRVLEYLRARKPMTKSEMLRGTHLTKQVRDRLLEKFEAENLVSIDGKVVRALSYPEFVEALYSRQTFPHPVNHWARLHGNDQSAA